MESPEDSATKAQRTYTSPSAVGSGGALGGENDCLPRSAHSEVPREVGFADSSEDEFPSAAVRSMSLPHISAAELLKLFPEDARSAYAPGFGCPHRPTPGSKSAKERSEQGARLAALAGRLRQNDFRFARGEAADYSSEHVFLEEETAIILDWDDTLFPSTFVAEVVDPCTDDQEVLPDNSPFLEQLHTHAIAALDFLHTTRRFGKIAIVTLARRPWVVSSATKYLPWLDIENFLRKYQISVFYARESLKCHMLLDTDYSSNVWTSAKHAAMKKALKKMKGDKPLKNVLSIGDSTIEKDALIELRCESGSGIRGGTDRILFKTVKLLDEPTPDQLVTQLGMLERHMNDLVQQKTDFDFACDE